MKAVHKLVVVLSLAALSSALFANGDEQAYLESCRKDPGVPVPVSVVAPTVGPEYAGAKLEVDFVVDSAGKPSDLSVKSAPDDTVAAAVTSAIKQWRFKPAERNGVAVATKVSLPIKIVDDAVTASSYAVNK